MYYVPPNAVLLIDRVMEWVEVFDLLASAWPSEPNGEPIMPANYKHGIETTLHEFRIFLASWCGVPPEYFAYCVNWTGDFANANKPVRSIAFTNMKGPSNVVTIDVPVHLSKAIGAAAQIEENKDGRPTEQIRVLKNSLSELRQSVVRPYDTPYGLLQVNRSCTRFWIGGKEVFPNPDQAEFLKEVIHSGQNGLSLERRRELLGGIEKPSKLFRSTKAGKLLWRFVRHKDSEDPRSNYVLNCHIFFVEKDPVSP